MVVAVDDIDVPEVVDRNLDRLVELAITLSVRSPF